MRGDNTHNAALAFVAHRELLHAALSWDITSTQLVLILHRGKLSDLSTLNGQLINGRARNHPSFLTSDTELFPGLIHHWAGEQNE